jgi:hypothetical protein
VKTGGTSVRLGTSIAECTLDRTAALLDGVLQQGYRDTGRCDVQLTRGRYMEAAYSLLQLVLRID